MKSLLTTVIIPVYNVEEYLPKCIESVCKQTYDNLQIILVDDGSTDLSGSICDKYAKLDRRIEVIHKENSDAGTARNAGLDNAKGEYICFVDSDDWVTEDFVEKSVCIMQDGYDFCVSGRNWFWEDGTSIYFGRWSMKSIRLTSVRKKRRFLLRWYCTCRVGFEVTGCMFRRCIIDDNNIRFDNQKEIGSEDFDFRLRYTACCKSLYCISEPHYNYLQRNTSIMHIKTAQGWANKILTLMERRKNTLAGDELFRPFYVFEGTFLSNHIDIYDDRKTPEQAAKYERDLYMASEHWEYLCDEAETALKNRLKIFQLCGLRVGSQVISFYHYILDGDIKAYSRGIFLQKTYEKLRDIKNMLLHGK